MNNIKIKELDTEYRSLVIELKDDNQMPNIVFFTYKKYKKLGIIKIFYY